MNDPLRRSCVVAGVALLIAGVVLTPARLETWLAGGRDLQWGPAFFRALLVFHGAALVGWARWRRGHPAPAEPARDPFLGPRSRWVLVTLMALALVLRAWQLDLCLWYDEVVAVIETMRGTFGDVVTTFASQNQHMLFSVAAYWPAQWFDEAAWAMRLPSVAFGVLTLWPLFGLGRKFLSEREALFACALMTVSYHHVWFSQNARGYAGLLFFATLSTWLWVEAGERRSARSWAAYSAAVVLGIWTHMTMVFVVGAHGLTWLAELALSRARRAEGHAEPPVRGPLLAWAFGATATLQLFALVLPQFLGGALHETSLESEWTNPLWMVRETLRNLNVSGLGIAVVSVAALVALAGWVDVLRRDWRIGLLTVLPAVLGGGTMIALGHNVWPRFFLYCLSFALLIAVHGAFVASRLALRPFGGERDQIARGVGSACAALMVLVSAWTVPRAYARPKQDFVGAREFVRAARADGEPIIAVGLAGVAYGEYFARDWDTALDADEFAAHRMDGRREWVVYTLPTSMRTYYADIWSVLEQDFEIVEEFHGTLGGGEVVVLRERE